LNPLPVRDCLPWISSQVVGFFPILSAGISFPGFLTAFDSRPCYPGPVMEQIRVVYEEFKVLGKELVDKVGQLIHAGNVRRIIVKDDKGNTFMEIPLTVATVGVIAAPVLAGLGAIAALIAHFTLGVERVKEETTEVAPEDARSGDT
jgi:hypothetical protein